MGTTLTLTGLAYLIVGAWYAWARIRYDLQTFWFARMPKIRLNSILAGITVALLVTTLWPLYWRLGKIHKWSDHRWRVIDHEKAGKHVSKFGHKMVHFQSSPRKQNDKRIP